MSPQSIQNAVSNGWPLHYFEGGEKDMGNLARFVTRNADLAARLNPPTKTTLVFDGERPAAKAKAAPKQEDSLALVKMLVGKGMSFQFATDAVEAPAKSLKKSAVFAELIIALGLEESATGKQAYEAIRDAK